jgi:predicted ATP-grasp superfamily ATP-dependent carboligase
VVNPTHIPAIVTALNLNGLGVARVLGRHGVHVIALHGGSDGPECKSRYVREIVRPEPGESAADCLLRIAPRFGDRRPVVMPITDETVESVAARLELLRAHYRVPMSDGRKIIELLSKDGIDAAARRREMPVPVTAACTSRDEMAAAVGRMRAPFILKPTDKSEAFQRSGAKKAYRLDTAAEVLSTYAQFADHEPRAVVQEFIPGSDADVWFCLMAMARDGRVLGAMVGHKIRQWPPHCGGTASCEPADAPELIELSARFFREEGVSGCCSIEYKRDPRDGRFYLIEPTVGRTDWQSAVADDNGVPIPYLVWCDETGTPLPRVVPKRIKRRWVHVNSDRSSADYYRRRGELGRLSWIWSIRPPVRPAYWAVDDLGPTFAILREATARILQKLGRPFTRRSTAPESATDRR